MTTVPLIVEAIFRFIPSALVVYLFIDVNLTSRFNKYIQWTCVSLLYMAAGLIGQYLREAYNIQVVDFSLALILVTCYSLFFHTDSVGFRIFIGSFSFLSQILVDTVFAAIIFVCFPDFNYEIGHLSYPALLAADIEMLIYGIFLFAATMVIKRVRLKTGINKKALVFMLFPLSQVLILCVIIKLIMANSENATAEITYFTLACVVICVISDVLCYRGLIQNSQLYETKMRNEQLAAEFQIQLIVKLLDALADMLRLHRKIFVVVKSYFHRSFPLWWPGTPYPGFKITNISIPQPGVGCNAKQSAERNSGRIGRFGRYIVLFFVKMVPVQNAKGTAAVCGSPLCSYEELSVWRREWLVILPRRAGSF